MADYKAYLDDLKENADYWKKKYGYKEYSRFKKYASAKYTHTGIEGADVTPSMRYIDDLTNNKDYWVTKYGEKQYDSFLDKSYKTYTTEYKQAYDTLSKVNTGIRAETLDRYGIQYNYSDDYEDRIRKYAGVAPASFNMSPYTQGLNNLPESWSDEEADTILGYWQKTQQERAQMERQAGARESYAQRPQAPQSPQMTQQDILTEGIKKGLTSNVLDINSEIQAMRPKDPIAERQKGARQAYTERQQQDKINSYYNLTQSPDFQEYATKGAALENPSWAQGEGGGSFNAFGWQPFAQKTPNKVKFYLDNSKAGGPQAYEYLTEEELGIYNYLLAKNGEEKADEFLGDMALTLSARKMDAMTAQAAEDAENSPILASIGSVAIAPAQGLGYLKAAGTALTGGEVDPNDPLFIPARSQQAIRGKVSEKIEGDDPTFLGQAGAFLYNTGISIADFLTTAGITGGAKTASLAIMASGSATNTTLDAYDRGASQEDALALGLLAGSAEAIFERFSLDNFLKMTKGGVKGAVFKNILKQSGIEASEEAATEIANILSDAVIMGDMSNYSIAVSEYMAQGMSKKEAEKQASIDLVKGVGLAALGGAISGGAVGSGGNIIGNIRNTSLMKDINATLAKDVTPGVRNYLENLKNNLETQNVQTTPDGQLEVPEIPDVQDTVAPQAQPQDIEPQQARTAIEPTQEALPSTPDIKTPQQGAQNATEGVTQTKAVQRGASGTAKTNSGDTKVRKTAESLLKAYEGTQYGDLIAEDIETGKANYTPESPVPVLQKAIEDVKSGNLTVDNYSSPVDDSGNVRRYNKNDMLKMLALIDDAAQRKDVKTEEILTAALYEAGTEAGRTVQSLSLIYKASPKAHLTSIERDITRFNAQQKAKDHSWKDVSLTKEETNAILNAPTYEQRKTVYAEAVKRINESLPSTLWNKIDQWRKTSMLLNPRTQIRNPLGNAVLMAANAAARKVEAGLQKVFLKPENRTVSGNIKPEYKALAKGDFDVVKDAYQSSGRWDIDAKLGQGHLSAFKNQGLGKIINKLTDVTGIALEWGDVIFGRHHYETALASYMQARNLKKITPAARAFAMKRALEATFRADSKAANAILRFVKTGGVVGKAAGVVMPFVKTPINIAKESFAYSPLGMGKSLLVDTYRVAKGKLDATQYIRNISKGIVGTAISALGFMLAKGLLIDGVELVGGWPEDEKEREALKAQGFQPFSLKINDTYFPLSWMQPISVPLFMGVTIADATETDEGLTWSSTADIAKVLFDSVAEISPLSGVQDAFTYKADIGEVAIGVGTSLASQMIPAVGKQASKVLDPKIYEMFKGDPLTQTKNQAVKGIPGLDALLETIGVDTDIAQKINIWGEPVKQSDNILERAALNFLSPATPITSKSDATTDEIMRLYKATKNGDVFPTFYDKRTIDTAAVRKITGESLKLSAKELQEMKEGIGRSSKAAVEKYLKSEQYQDDSDTERVKTISNIYSDVVALYEEAKARGLKLSAALPKVKQQSESHFKGDAEFPIPDAVMLMGKYDYGVNNAGADALFDLYKETGKKSYLLDKFDKTEKKDVIDAVLDVVKTKPYQSQTEATQQKIIDDIIRDFDSVLNPPDPMAKYKEPQKEVADTKEYYTFAQPGWKEYGDKDKVVTRLKTLNVYPKQTDSFNDKRLLQGAYTLTDADKQLLAEMTYKALLPSLNSITAEDAQKIINNAYTAFKNEIVRRQ